MIFLDTFKFLACNMDALPSNLKEKQFRENSKHFSNELLVVVTKKVIYAYEYIDNIKKLKDNKLANEKYFYSKRNKLDISDEEQNHHKVWGKSNIKILE